MRDNQIQSYTLLLKYILLGFAFLNAFQIYGGSVFLFAIIACILVLAANDTLRKFLKMNAGGLTASLLISVALAALIKYFAPGIGATIYIFVPLFELFYLKGTRVRILLSAHAAAYFTVLFLAVPFDAEKTAAAGTATLLYLGVACMSWLLHTNGREKEEIKKLNEELTVSNNMLTRYARQAEELTITRERSRVAQELHDSLGHSLMALSMNLEYAEKITDVKPEQVKEMLGKAKDLSKKSIADLRNAVEALKAERGAKDLADSIGELAQSFGCLQNVDIYLDSALENANAELKNCIYKAVREGLTNGLVHGGATVFTIQAQITDGIVQLQIKDNGTGCAHIDESTGLLGIRERVAALGGHVAFSGSGGFEITAQIPVSREDSND